MAVIEIKQTGDKLILQNQHTIGRHSSNISVINENDVSRKHAVVHWENNSWFLTDFSSNGTLVNNDLIHRSIKKLKKNDTIRFSKKLSGVWKLTNANGPSSFLKSLSSKDIIELENGLIVSKQNSEFTFFRNNEQRWVMDDSNSEIILEDKQTYSINNTRYLFIENECQNATEMHIDVTTGSSFHLLVSNDEETVSSKIKINNMELDLGTRSYNYLLLYLARVKKESLEKSINEASSGWVYMENISDALSKEMLREIDEYYINNLIYRLRKQLFDLQPYGHLFVNIIERKNGKLRLGLTNFTIEKEHIKV